MRAIFMKKNFYITTPIYYGNGLPHIGHFYTSTIANILYTYHKISWYNARFTTGIDENSQKAVIKAKQEGKDLYTYLDDMAKQHKEVWDYFDIGYTDFIRTTEKRHHKVVQDVLQKCYERGDIYEWEYEWMYCVWCEAFKRDDDLVFQNKLTGETFPITPKVQVSDNIIKVCPDHLTPPDMIREKNYFFRLSKYQTWLIEFYEAYPEFIMPDFRFNEVKAFVQRGLEDFSISRENHTFGIPLPFDNSQVTYVWFDALFNYYTSCMYSPVWTGEENITEEYWRQFQDASHFWPASLHTVGKDIIRFHGIFWPAMLASYFDLWEQREGVLHFRQSDYEKLPQSILVGGYFTVDGQKMSKSLGNVIEPISYCEKYSQDMLILYMLSAFPIGNDGDYDRGEAIKLYNARLANNLGNLLNRVLVLSLKLPPAEVLSPNWSSKKWGVRLLGECDEKICSLLAYLQYSLSYEFSESQQKELKETLEKNNETLHVPSKGKYKNYDLKWVLDECFMMLDKLNKYADETQPWVLVKTDEAEARQVLYTLAEGLRQVSLYLYPFFPKKMNELHLRLWLSNYQERLHSGELMEILEERPDFFITEKGEVLYARIEE